MASAAKAIPNNLDECVGPTVQKHVSCEDDQWHPKFSCLQREFCARFLDGGVVDGNALFPQQLDDVDRATRVDGVLFGLGVAASPGQPRDDQCIDAVRPTCDLVRRSVRRTHVRIE